ncbi:hypothetical protein [Rhodoglobus sp.]
MRDNTVRPERRPLFSRPRSTAPWGLAAAIVLIALAISIPALTGWDVYANHFPPLHALWLPHVGPGTIPAVILAIVLIRWGGAASARLPWKKLLVASFAASLLWLASLALVDGPSGLGAILNSGHEYLPVARAVTDVGGMLQEYISRIPLDSTDNWPTHVAGHPPGALLFFWALVQWGLGWWLPVGIIVIVLGASVPVAVLVSLRQLGAEPHARVAAPFLVAGPAAIWMAVSADGMFAAFAAWGLCLLTLATSAKSRRATAAWGVASGLVLGFCIFLSYGLILIGVLAIAVLVVAKNWRPLPWAFASAALVAVAFAVAGFAWWEAYPVIVDRYWDGIASRRPFEYWVWANIAALAINAGPVLGTAITSTVCELRHWKKKVAEDRVVVWLAAAALTAVLLADLSGMSKGEVERIWLPFVPWILIATAWIPPHLRQGIFATQLIFALLVQHLLFTGW